MYARAGRSLTSACRVTGACNTVQARLNEPWLGHVAWRVEMARLQAPLSASASLCVVFDRMGWHGKEDPLPTGEPYSYPWQPLQRCPSSAQLISCSFPGPGALPERRQRRGGEMT